MVSTLISKINLDINKKFFISILYINLIDLNKKFNFTKK